MVSAPKEAAAKWCLINGWIQRLKEYLRSLILTGIPIVFQTHEVTI
jgi:hypothetical protein